VSVAPDYVGPVVGWRVWSLAEGGGRVRLASHISPSVWEPGQELVAACEVRRRAPLAPWQTRPTGHTAPAARCTCGVHAVRRVGLLATYLPVANRPYSWMRPVVRQAIGRVAEEFRLSAGERQLLLSARRGEGLLAAGPSSRVSFQALASPAEHFLCTSDPAEIARMQAGQPGAPGPAWAGPDGAAEEDQEDMLP